MAKTMTETKVSASRVIDAAHETICNVVAWTTAPSGEEPPGFPAVGQEALKESLANLAAAVA